MKQTNDLFGGRFQLQQGDGDGPKQVPTLLGPMASSLSWGPTTRLLAQSNYITLFPAPLPFLLLPLFQHVLSTAAGRVPAFVCAQRTQTDSGGSCETTPGSLNLTALTFPPCCPHCSNRCGFVYARPVALL